MPETYPYPPAGDVEVAGGVKSTVPTTLEHPPEPEQDQGASTTKDTQNTQDPHEIHSW